MNSNDGNPNNGKVPRAGTNRFSAVFAKRGKGASAAAGTAPHGARVIHEKESSLPDTLVDGLVPPAPLSAAKGDDDVMSEPPKKGAPTGKAAKAKPGNA